MDLDDSLFGGVFQMKYDHDCDIIASHEFRGFSNTFT